jgi:Peptidase A4 family
MLSKHFAILALLAGLPALAQGPAADVSPSTAPISMRQHAPMRLYGVPVPGYVDSTNWGGYAVTGSGFTKALGSWIVPTANCTKTPNTYSSYWLGLDGVSDETVEQIGTEADCYGSSPSYYAWYEFYPNAAVLISGITVSPGDKMSATVEYSDSKFTLMMTDHTTGKTFKWVRSFSGAERTSAEWIVEAPVFSGEIQPLADFKMVSLGDDYTKVRDTNWAIDSGVTGPISDFGAGVLEITMVTSLGALKAWPSGITTDGSSFKVTWAHE